MSAFSARRYFEGARAAMREADAKRRMRELMRSREGVRAQGYEAVGRSGISDPMSATDARMDAEQGLDAEIAALEAEVDEAVAVCRRVRALDPTCYGGSLLELHYFGLLSWREAARSVGVSETSARDEARRALSLIEDVGVCRVLHGWGQMELPV